MWFFIGFGIGMFMSLCAVAISKYAAQEEVAKLKRDAKYYQKHKDDPEEWEEIFEPNPNASCKRCNGRGWYIHQYGSLLDIFEERVECDHKS